MKRMSSAQQRQAMQALRVQAQHLGAGWRGASVPVAEHGAFKSIAERMFGWPVRVTVDEGVGLP
jgi:hypothetical protein